MHFFKVTALIKNELRQRLEKFERDADLKQQQVQTGVLGNVYSWFVSKEASSEGKTAPVDGRDDHGVEFSDKKFLTTLRKELKIFEMCIRIFEQECI